MSLLEERYRRVLWLLPAFYRAEREEEMVCAFMEGAGDLADADNPRPRWSEIASVAALAMRVRLGSVGAPPRYLPWGEAVRLVAVLGLFFQAMMSFTWLADLLRLYANAGYQTLLGEAGSVQRVQNIAQALTYLLWLAVFVSLVRGRPRAAKALTLLALALFYSPILQERGLMGEQSGEALAVQSLLFVVPVLALLAGFHRDAPRPCRPWWVAVVPVGAGVVLQVTLTAVGSMALAPTINWQTWSWIWPWMSESGLACLAFLIMSIACFGTHLRTPGRRSPALLLAMAILVMPMTFAHAFYLAFGAADPATSTMAAVNISQLVALVLCGVTLTVLATKTTNGGRPTAPNRR